MAFQLREEGFVLTKTTSEDEAIQGLVLSEGEEKHLTVFQEMSTYLPITPCGLN